MQAGRLRHRVTIQEPVKDQDPETGAVINSWRDVVTVWAEITDLSAREFIAAQAVNSAVTTKIVIRFRHGVTNRNRIVHQDVIYNIAGVLADNKSGRDYLTIPCFAGVNDG